MNQALTKKCKCFFVYKTTNMQYTIEVENKVYSKILKKSLTIFKEIIRLSFCLQCNLKLQSINNSPYLRNIPR